MQKTGNKAAKAKLHIDKNLQIVFSVTLMAMLGVTIITPAFPRISTELQLPPQQVGLLVTVFTLPVVILSPFLGALADWLGRKRILVPALLLFGIAGTACSFVSDFKLLLVLRLIQGMGASPLNTLNWTLIGDLYSGKQRIKFMGYNSSTLSLGNIFYPVIGGALATLNWRYPFIVSILAIPVGLLVLFALKTPERSQPENISSYLKKSLHMMKNVRIIGLLTTSIFTGIILYGPYMTYFPFFAGSAFGAAGFAIGLVMSSRAVFTTITSSQTGRLAGFFPQENLLKASCLIYALALICVPFVSNIWLFLVPAALFGIAHGISVPTKQSLVSEVAGEETRGAFMAISMMLFAFGQTLGPLAAGLAFTYWGASGVFFGGTAIAIVSFFMISIMVKPTKLKPRVVKTAR